MAWVGVTPLVMADVRRAGVPATAPGLPAFAETNLRTYVRRGDGGDGIWFLSVEAAVLDEMVTTAAGLPAPFDERVVHFSPGVGHVRLGASRPLFT
ncbi:DUF2071 domain-containing protein [Streptomyces canus]|uniref:DUF2071 domain-containing protein n=1 Tax=Streptomyces canus TaxID=58343 RepID=UPI00371CCE95